MCLTAAESLLPPRLSTKHRDAKTGRMSEQFTGYTLTATDNLKVGDPLFNAPECKKKVTEVDIYESKLLNSIFPDFQQQAKDRAQEIKDWDSLAPPPPQLVDEKDLTSDGWRELNCKDYDDYVANILSKYPMDDDQKLLLQKEIDARKTMNKKHNSTNPNDPHVKTVKKLEKALDEQEGPDVGYVIDEDGKKIYMSDCTDEALLRKNKMLEKIKKNPALKQKVTAMMTKKEDKIKKTKTEKTKDANHFNAVQMNARTQAAKHNANRLAHESNALTYDTNALTHDTNASDHFANARQITPPPPVPPPLASLRMPSGGGGGSRHRGEGAGGGGWNSFGGNDHNNFMHQFNMMNLGRDVVRNHQPRRSTTSRSRKPPILHYSSAYTRKDGTKVRGCFKGGH